MATQTVEFRAATGLTITAKLFAAASDTEVASVSATEATNRKGTYSAAFTDVPAGEYILIALSSGLPVASWWVTLTLSTATFQVYDRTNVDLSDLTDAVGALPTVEEIQAADRLVLVSTTIATLASQTSFTLTAGSSDNDAYKNCFAIITDAASSVQKSVRKVIGYIGSTKTITLERAPDFIVAVTDLISIVARLADTHVTVSLQSSLTNGTRIASTSIYINQNELKTYTFTVLDNGSPVDLSLFNDLVVKFRTVSGVEVLSVIPAVSGDDNNQYSFTTTEDVSQNIQQGSWSCRRSSGTKQVFGKGEWFVEPAV